MRMKNLFDINSPIMIFLGHIMDLMTLSLLWIACSIPIVTIGPSTAALYYVTLKIIRNKESGIAKSFFISFKENFKQGVILTIVLLIVGIILAADLWFFISLSDSIGVIPNIIFGVLLFLYFGMLSYTFPLQAQFSNTIRGTLKNAVILAIRNIIITVLTIILNCFPAIIAFLSTEMFLKLIPIWVLLAPAGIAHLCSTHFAKIFDPLIEAATTLDG